MDGQRDGPGGPRRGEHLGAVAAGGVHDELAGLPPAELGEPGHEAGKHVVGDGEEDQLGALDDLVHGEHGHAGQQRLDPVAALLRDRGGADDGVADGAQGAGEDGADPAGADHADPEAAGAGGGGTCRRC